MPANILSLRPTPSRARFWTAPVLWRFGISFSFLLSLLLSGCSQQSQLQRTVQAIGPEKLRTQALASCNNQFPREDPVKISESNWPPAVRAFHPLSVWAEPDGLYLLLDSDADGERGLFLPRIIAEKDPVCTPRLKHTKLAVGVYWYDRRRG